MGLVLYVVGDVSCEKFERVVKDILPFYLPMLLVLRLITAFPTLLLWLPGFDFQLSKNCRPSSVSREAILPNSKKKVFLVGGSSRLRQSSEAMERWPDNPYAQRHKPADWAGTRPPPSRTDFRRNWCHCTLINQNLRIGRLFGGFCTLNYNISTREPHHRLTQLLHFQIALALARSD